MKKDALDFLKNKGIIEPEYEKFIIKFDDGREIELVDLLVEYSKKDSIISDEILQETIDTWGVDSQFEMVVEECLELALSIQKMKRLSGDKKQKYFNMVDELADVLLMSNQLRFMVDGDLLNERIEFKRNRLVERLKEAKK